MRRRMKPITEFDKIFNRAKRNFNKSVQLAHCYSDGYNIYFQCYTCGAQKLILCTYGLHSCHAGHAWKDISYSSVEFDRRAVKGQCYKCNVKLSGNESVYQEKLKNELGTEEYEDLLLKKNQVKKWTYSELEEINRDSLKLIKEHKTRLGLE